MLWEWSFEHRKILKFWRFWCYTFRRFEPCYCGKVVKAARPSQGRYHYTFSFPPSPPRLRETRPLTNFVTEVRFASMITVVVVQDVSALRRAGGIDGDRRSSSEIIKVFKAASTLITTRAEPDAHGTWHPPPPRFILLSMFCFRKSSANVVDLYFLADDSSPW